MAMFKNVLVVILFGALGFGAYMWQANSQQEVSPQIETVGKPDVIEPKLEQAYFINPARPILWSELTAHDGTVYKPENLKGKWSYLYMGYRSCPDACPVALSILSKVSKRLVELSLDQPRQFIFLSVDPGRDTPELLAEYVAFFGSDFVGVTGADIQLKAIAIQLGGLFHVPEDPKSDNYEVGHSDSIYLMNPEGKMRLISRPPHDVEMIVRNHLKLVN